MINSISYKTISKKEALNIVIGKRLRNNKAYIVFFKKNHLECALIYEPYSYLSVQHLDFHALSDGWDDLTSTGYTSIFIRRPSIASRTEIIDYLREYTEKINLNIDKPIPCQQSLF